MTVETAWPDEKSCAIFNRGRTRYYRTEVGLCPSVTTVLKVLGLSREALIAWSANEERKATIEAAVAVRSVAPESDAGFAALIESRIGPVKQHLKLMSKAADIGTQVHDMIRWRILQDITMGQGLGAHSQLSPVISDPAQWAFMAWEDWWKDSGLKPLRVEQPIYHPEHRYAGTIDLIAEGKDGLELWDWKTANGVYPEHHLQAAAYLFAAREFAPVARARIGRLPKTVDDPKFEIVEVGKMDDRTLSEANLQRAFLASLEAWRILCEMRSATPEEK